MRTRTLIVTAAGLLTAALGVRMHAQAPAPADPDTKIWQGVYTSAQAARGKTVYEAYCTRCHGIDMVGGRQGGAGGPALVGDNFWLDWERSSLGSLYSKISKTMPNDSPGSLRSDDYADLLAYILSGNTFPAGTADIPADGSGLDVVRIVRKAGDVAEASNFSLVQVVGCLAPGPGTALTLTRSTPPIPTREERPSAAALKDAESRELGGDTVRLIGAARYAQANAGRKVEARGLLNRTGSETRLDVLSLSAVGERCGG